MCFYTWFQISLKYIYIYIKTIMNKIYTIVNLVLWLAKPIPYMGRLKKQMLNWQQNVTRIQNKYMQEHPEQRKSYINNILYITCKSQNKNGHLQLIYDTTPVQHKRSIKKTTFESFCLIKTFLGILLCLYKSHFRRFINQ